MEKTVTKEEVERALQKNLPFDENASELLKNTLKQWKIN